MPLTCCTWLTVKKHIYFDTIMFQQQSQTTNTPWNSTDRQWPLYTSYKCTHYIYINWSPIVSRQQFLPGTFFISRQYWSTPELMSFQLLLILRTNLYLAMGTIFFRNQHVQPGPDRQWNNILSTSVNILSTSVNKHNALLWNHLLSLAWNFEHSWALRFLCTLI